MSEIRFPQNIFNYLCGFFFKNKCIICYKDNFSNSLRLIDNDFPCLKNAHVF